MKRTDKGIRRKHGLTFQDLRRFYSLTNVVVVAFLSCLKDFFEKIFLVFWGMEFQNLTPNRESELHRIFNREYLKYKVLFDEALVF